MLKSSVRVRGFTLVELLVVIAIISVIAGFLIPTLMKARGKADEVKCQSNLRELQRLGMIYADSGGNRFYPLAKGTAPQAHESLMMLVRANEGLKPKLFMCPTCREEPAEVDADGKFIYTPRSGLETDRSDYVTGLYLAPSNNLRAVGQLRLDEHDLSIRRADVYAGANYGPFSASAIYSFTASDPTLIIPQDQQDIYALLGVRLTDRWSAAASVRYDIDAGNRLQDAVQLRYADECFVLTATYTETFINDPARDIVPDRSVMLRFELKHLGEFRYKTDAIDHVFSENQPAR